MVRGLDLFRQHFAEYASRYVLIGGTACDLAFVDAGLEFRATQDLDIVLCLEAMDARFSRRFWEFIDLGGYVRREATSPPTLYRFAGPVDARFPKSIELFSRAPDALEVPAGARLVRIPAGGDVSSLSAILMDHAYYDWVCEGRATVQGLPVLKPAHLIPLKARAWLDLRERRMSGQPVDSSDIKKHRNDVFRLFRLLEPAARHMLAAPIAADMRRFATEVLGETIDLKPLGIPSRTAAEVVAALRAIYQLGAG